MEYIEKCGKTKEHLEISENGGTPKWMVFVRENPTKMDDLEVPPFMETPMCKTYGKHGKKP